MFTCNSNTSSKSIMECTLILIPFTLVAASLHKKLGKHKLHITASSLASETCHFDSAGGSVHVKIGVRIKAGPQPLSRLNQG